MDKDEESDEASFNSIKIELSSYERFDSGRYSASTRWRVIYNKDSYDEVNSYAKSKGFKEVPSNILKQMLSDIFGI